MNRQHLHRDDCPHALAVLYQLFEWRPADAAGIGFEPTDYGALVDWDRMTGSWLSTTELAVVHIARGIAALERHGGGVPPALHQRLRAAVAAIT